MNGELAKLEGLLAKVISRCYLTMENEKIAELARWLKKSRYTVIFTGAGMDTESNIPDYRSKAGWWRKIDPQFVASKKAFTDYYDMFQEYFRTFLRRIEGVQPHAGHYVLAEWEKQGLLQALVTQNISGLHAAAGSKCVYELHGNLRSIYCSTCEQELSVADFLSKETCPVCHNYTMRPDVVLFGEGLPEEAWSGACEAVKRAELLLVVGTSLKVSPANQLPWLAKGRTVLLNNEEPVTDYGFDLKIMGGIKVALEAVRDALQLA